LCPRGDNYRGNARKCHTGPHCRGPVKKNMIAGVSPEPFRERAYRFARALVVGSGATLVDFSIFTTCMRVAKIAPTSARLPALVAGASVQFLGNRTFTFRAQAGSLTRQAKLFLAAELFTLGLNWSTFRLLAPRIRALPPEIVGFIGSFIVFVTFAYPMRKLVIFRLPQPNG
jgi:putative flippase GtrA